MSQKIKVKTDQKNTSLKLKEGARMRNNLKLPKSTFSALLNLHIQFQFLSSIWWGDRGGTALFHSQKGKTSISLLLTNLRGLFLDMFHIFELSID